METQIRDELWEICNIGVGSCMTSLSHMIGRVVHYSMSYANELENCGNTAGWFRRADDYVAGVTVPFDGDIEGAVLLIFQPSMTEEILARIFGSGPAGGSISNEMLDLIQETANIMASSYLASLSAYTSWHIKAGCSAASTDMAGAMIGEVAGMAIQADRQVFCVDSRFGMDEGAQESCMLIMIYEHSIRGFLETF